MNNYNDLKVCIAARAGLYKSYIKNVKLIETRTTGHAAGWCENDYEFTYKGSYYKITEKQHGKYSALSDYKVIKL